MWHICRPSCFDFQSWGGTPNFTWDEFMGGWLEGTEYGAHYPYGIMDLGLMNAVQQMRDWNGAAIILSSGYRCPYGNRAAGSRYLRTSQHMYGTAVDISTGGDREYYARLEGFAVRLGLSPLPWETYPNDRHLHIGL